MYRYILKRLLMAIPVLIGATFLVFTIMHFAPGDPAKIILGSSATEAALELKREELGLNDPFFVQFGNFMLGLLQGDMGTSYRKFPRFQYELVLFSRSCYNKSTIIF